LLYFQRLGFDHVNIIDEGCRKSALPQPLQRKKSFNERQTYAGTRRKKHKHNRTKKRVRISLYGSP